MIPKSNNHFKNKEVNSVQQLFILDLEFLPHYLKAERSYLVWFSKLFWKAENNLYGSL